MMTLEDWGQSKERAGGGISDESITSNDEGNCGSHLPFFLSFLPVTLLVLGFLPGRLGILARQSVQEIWSSDNPLLEGNMPSSRHQRIALHEREQA